MTTAFVRNPRRRPVERTPRLNFPRAFHQRLPNYSPTPLLHLPELAAELGVADLWVKDETSRMGLRSHDILGAAWALYRAVLSRSDRRPAHWVDLAELRERLAGRDPLHVVVVSDSEFAVAAAVAAEWLGYACTAYVPGGESPARIDAVREAGAVVTVGGLTYDDALARAATEAGADTVILSDSSWDGYEEIPSWVTEGFTTVFEEVDDELFRRGAEPPGTVVLPMGVGALAASAGLHYRVVDEQGGTIGPRPVTGDVTLVGAEPALAPCFSDSATAGRRCAMPAPAPSVMDTLARGLPSPLACDVVAETFDGFVAVEDRDALLAVRLLEEHGVVCSPSGAAPVGALLSAGVVGDLVDRASGVLVVVGEGCR